MRPLQLTHGSRPVTQVLYGSDGDVLFTASKDSSAAMWYTHNGEVGNDRREAADRAQLRESRVCAFSSFFFFFLGSSHIGLLESGNV